MAKLAIGFQTTFALKWSLSVRFYDILWFKGFSNGFRRRSPRYGAAAHRYCLVDRVRLLLNLPPSFPRRRESRPRHFGNISRLLQFLTYEFLRIFLSSVGMGITATVEQGGRLRWGGSRFKKLLNSGSSKLFERSSENLNRFSDDLCFGTELCFVLFVFHRFGRNGREPADQKQQHADDDEGGDAGDTAAVGKLDEEELDDDDGHQRRAGYPEGAQFAAVAVHHQDDGGHRPDDGEAGLQAEGLEHDVEAPSDAVVEMPQAHHTRADDHECEGGDAGRVHAAVFQR